jgi:hypothetical protein
MGTQQVDGCACAQGIQKQVTLLIDSICHIKVRPIIDTKEKKSKGRTCGAF